MASCGKNNDDTSGPTYTFEPPTSDTGAPTETGEPDTPPDTGDSDTDTDPGPFAGRFRSCDSTFRYDGSAGTVFVAGEWGWEEADWVPLVDTGAGFETGLPLYDDLGPGVYCYKLIVDGEWIFDPANPYQAYCDGVANSGVRVGECALPSVELEGEVTHTGDGLRARVLFSAGSGGSGPGELVVTVEHNFERTELPATWAGDWAVDIDVSGLPTGKHTVRVEAWDEAGAAAETLLLPLWVEDTPFEWSDALLYMIMIDRFVNGDPSNDEAPDPIAAEGGDWVGGDLAGIEQQIRSGYFDDLGVRALWLTPFNTGAQGAEIASDNWHYVSGYHGYWPIEPREVDPRLGDAEALKSMVAAAHEHGIRVIMDLVVNHVHEDHPYVAEHPEWFNDGCICGTSGCDWTEERLTCLFAEYMPDIDWRNGDASEQFIADALWWIETFDLDGARIDAVKHVDDLAVFNMATRINERFEQSGVDIYLDGETAMGWAGDDLAANESEYGTINQYMGPDGLDGQFDFVLYHAVVDNVFVHDNKGMIHLDVWTGYSQTEYVAGSVMTPYVGSHDTSRLITMADYNGRWGNDGLDGHKWVEDGLPPQPTDDEPYQRVRTALCWLLTIPGAPMIYQGDEYGEYGGGDPDNRHPLRLAGELDARESGLLTEVQALGTLRQDLSALRRGTYQGRGSTEEIMVFSRDHAEGSVLVAINGSPWDTSAWVDVYGMGFDKGLGTDTLGWGGGITVVGDNATVEVPARSCAVFVP